MTNSSSSDSDESSGLSLLDFNNESDLDLPPSPPPKPASPTSSTMFIARKLPKQVVSQQSSLVMTPEIPKKNPRTIYHVRRPKKGKNLRAPIWPSHSTQAIGKVTPR